MEVKQVIHNQTIQNTTKKTLGLTTIVFIIFLVMKLGEIGQVAEWSWWWVTCPLWITWAAIAGVIIGFFAIVGFILLLAAIFSR